MNGARERWIEKEGNTYRARERWNEKEGHVYGKGGVRQGEAGRGGAGNTNRPTPPDSWLLAARQY